MAFGVLGHLRPRAMDSDRDYDNVRGVGRVGARAALQTDGHR